MGGHARLLHGFTGVRPMGFTRIPKHVAATCLPAPLIPRRNDGPNATRLQELVLSEVRDG